MEYKKSYKKWSNKGKTLNLPYDEKKDQLAEPNHLRRWTMEYVREIRDKFGIQLEEKVLASRICIAINKPLFTITKVTPQSGKIK